MQQLGNQTQQRHWCVLSLYHCVSYLPLSLLSVCVCVIYVQIVFNYDVKLNCASEIAEQLKYRDND